MVPSTVESEGDLGGGRKCADDLAEEVTDSVAHVGIVWATTAWPQAEIEEIREAVGDHRDNGWNDLRAAQPGGSSRRGCRPSNSNPPSVGAHEGPGEQRQPGGLGGAGSGPAPAPRA